VEIDPYTERCFDIRLDLLRNSGPEAFVRAQPIFLYPANWIATHAGSLAEEAKLQLAHFPGAANVEKRIAAARAFDLWFDMPDADILAIATEDDMLVPSECSKDIERRLNGAAKLGVMEHGGHACNVTDPETFNRLVLDFLGE
jgi:aminoacrylate hydrolase